MANGAALISQMLWRDPDFRKLPRLAQCTYVQVLSQKDLDCAGVLTLHVELMAKGCAEFTVDQLRHDFEALEDARFVFIDEETDELFVRSYIRNASIKSPNAWKSAKRSALLVQSTKIRVELAAELRRLRRKDAEEIADQLNPSVPPLDPIGNPSERDIPSEPVAEPPVPVPVTGHLLSVGTHLGEESPRCSKHVNDPDAPNCWACKRKREAQEQNTLKAAEVEKSVQAERRRRELECPVCEGTNWIPDTEPAVRCDHQEQAHA